MGIKINFILHVELRRILVSLAEILLYSLPFDKDTIIPVFFWVKPTDVTLRWVLNVHYFWMPYYLHRSLPL